MSFGAPQSSSASHGHFVTAPAIDPGLSEGPPSHSNSNMSAQNQGQPQVAGQGMVPPPPAVYSSLEELISQANIHAQSQGYKFVVVRSKTNTQGQKTWVHLACDRHGTKRNTHNLTPETRKKNRRSRRCECPMYCVASKSSSELWELTVRQPEHNHGPYEAPPKKKRDLPQPHSSEAVNLPLLQTPSACTADFCLIPLGTSSPSVSHEIAEVQRLLKRSGLQYSMHSSGTTVEGTWDEVTKIIGQAHSLLHGSGVARIQTDIRIGSRNDKKQSFQDKVAAVNALLEGEDVPQQTSEDGVGDETNDTHSQSLSHALTHNINSAISPDLERVMATPIPHGNHGIPHGMHHPMVQQVHPHHPHPLAQGMPMS